MTRLHLILALVFSLLAAVSAGAQPSAEKILPMDGKISEDGQSIELNWFDAQPPRVGSVTVKRRLYGQLGGQSWQVIGDALGPVMRYTDTTIRPGVAYEYQVLRSAHDIVDVGYWLAGSEIPSQAKLGNAYVIVDETVAGAIAPRLARFEQDLIGDGWTIEQHSTPRGNARTPVENLANAAALKEWLRSRYNADPFGRHVVILVGHVPIVKSGQVAPDGHGGRAHPTDLFYADMDGRWSATRAGEILNSRVPGDFIEMQVGRIDFSPVSKDVQETELRLLRAYFDKNHHWRMGYLGDLRAAYGNTHHLVVEQAALRNIVGPDNITTGGHYDIGGEKPWLWGVDFGRNDGSSHANKVIFALNFGSHKQMFDTRFNGMTTLLSQPWYTLAVGWGARPAWWLHHMALGGTIGDVHMRTVNNGQAAAAYRESLDYFPTGPYLMRNGIWINLMGDPTLQAFPLAPPHQLTARSGAEGVKLSWQPTQDPDALGYHVFRALPDQNTFETLTGAAPIAATEFLDPDPVEGARYMVRAYGVKNVHAGSFYTYSQGVFTANHAVSEPDQAVSAKLVAPPDQPLSLPAAFNGASDGKIYAFIRGPATGQLTQGDAGWIYTPPDGFTGQVDLPFSISDQWETTRARLHLQIGE